MDNHSMRPHLLELVQVVLPRGEPVQLADLSCVGWVVWRGEIGGMEIVRCSISMPTNMDGMMPMHIHVKPDPINKQNNHPKKKRMESISISEWPPTLPEACRAPLWANMSSTITRAGSHDLPSIRRVENKEHLIADQLYIMTYAPMHMYIYLMSILQNHLQSTRIGKDSQSAVQGTRAEPRRCATHLA